MSRASTFFLSLTVFLFVWIGLLQVESVQNSKIYTFILGKNDKLRTSFIFLDEFRMPRLMYHWFSTSRLKRLPRRAHKIIARYKERKGFHGETQSSMILF